MTDWSPEQIEALQIARDLINMGAPIFTAKPNHGKGSEFIYPDAWQTFRPNQRQVDLWRPGDALCMVTGVVFDVLDIDPRNGGEYSLELLAAELGWNALGSGPRNYGAARTPSSGQHLLMGRTFLAKTTKLGKGLDLQAGGPHGEGRGFVYIAPTVRVSKYGPNEGRPVAYRWASIPTSPNDAVDEGLERLRDHILAKSPTARTRPRGPVDKVADEDYFAFADYAADWTAAEANQMIDNQIRAVMAATDGEINNALGGAARVLGRFVAGGYLDEDTATQRLLAALELGGVHSDRWNLDNGRKWTAATVIGAAFGNAASGPWTVDSAPVQTQPVDLRTQSPAEPNPSPATSSAPKSVPASARVTRLEILSAADSAYWLQNELGANGLAGFFLRDGRVVHTPLVNDLGYAPPKVDADDNGPAQIQAVSPGQLAARIQYAYACYKTAKGKDGKPDSQVPALFPLQAAQRAVDAPEAMGMLRALAGITMTPMVRSDGSVLERPGYDPASRYLFLPGPGVNVRPVPGEPAAEDVAKAVGLLEQMLAEFPWETKDDKVNYLGLLLTPMLRMVVPPTYKMFGISAHQPGSGKTLLADIATTLHGGVLRSEAPEDEAEWRKQVTGILSGTSAPVVHIDNITGILRSSVLAGALTAGQALQDRELGSNRILTMDNDRVWVVTGNNLSLGGDLVRRTITIMIDPNTADPESREFAIGNLIGWVRENRNELLWSLLVMIRHWVAIGRPLGQRSQSDSFGPWEKAVSGILTACGIAGEFDNQSGKRAARGGDDDGMAETLAHLRDRFTDRTWTVLEALDGIEHAEIGDFITAGRDWLPSVVLDKLARSETAGRKSFGYWLRNRVGRWVNDADGRSLVIREVGRTMHGMTWRVDQA